MKRLVKLNGQLTDLLANAGTLLNGNFQSYAASPYSAYTGMWGVNVLPQNANLQATSTLRVFPATFPKGSVFTWNVTRDPNWSGVEGYLSTSYGNYDGSPGRITPWPVYAITALSVAVGWTYTGDASSGLLCECWLSPTAAATGPVPKSYEVAFFPKTSTTSLAYFNGLSAVGSGSFTDTNGVVWNVRVDTGGTYPYFIACRPGGVDFQGPLPFKDYFAFLIAAGKITGNEWFNGVAFGVEPYSGAGTLGVTDFTATYAGGARVPWTISNLAATAQPTAGTVTLAWSPAPGATSHQYRVNGGTWTNTSGSSAQTVTGLAASTAYTFEVRGVNVTGNGASSNVASATTSATVSPPYSDTFPGPSIDSTKWPTVTGSPTPTIVSGRLRTAPASGEVDSGAVYDLTKYRVYIQIPTLPTDTAGTMKTRFWVADSGYSNIIQYDIEGNPKILWSQGNGITPATVATYNATSHQWVGLQVVSGNLLFQGSPDGVTWTTYRTVAAPAWLTSSLVRVMLGCFETGTTQAAGQYAEYDNFNS